MVLATRGVIAIGLGIVGLSLVVGPLRAEQDGSVHKTTSPTGTGSASAAAPAAPVPPVIGTVDIEAVFRRYEKCKVFNKEFQNAMLARQNELMKIEAEAKDELQLLNKMTVGTQDFKTRENRVTELKARLAAGREQAQREFQGRECENMATIYKEVQLMVTAIAQWRKMNYVVRVSNIQPNGTDPNTVTAALMNNMVYFDPRNDITNDVIFNLNRRYKAAHPASAAPAPNAGAGAGTGAARPE